MEKVHLASPNAHRDLRMPVKEILLAGNQNNSAARKALQALWAISIALGSPAVAQADVLTMSAGAYDASEADEERRDEYLRSLYPPMPKGASFYVTVPRGMYRLTGESPLVCAPNQTEVNESCRRNVGRWWPKFADGRLIRMQAYLDSQRSGATVVGYAVNPRGELFIYGKMIPA